MHQKPYLEKYEMPIGLEKLARDLVYSGQLRIDAENHINFARFSVPNRSINRMFSKRELYSRNLLQNTKKLLRFYLKFEAQGRNLEKVIWNHIIYMRRELRKYRNVEFELEMKIARILVQSVEPIVIGLILLEKVEVFVSYSYNIGDVLDVVVWQQAGENSGMQSTDGVNCAIFVSTGGNPFRPNEKENEVFGDGMPAMARMMVIAGQEMGHYSDLIRDLRGRYVARHSANLSCTHARDEVSRARKLDLKHVEMLRWKFEKIGFKKLIFFETHVKFFREHKRSGLIKFSYLICALVLRRMFLTMSCFLKLHGFVQYFFRFQYVGLALDDMLKDMAFNLSPKADVYRKENEQEEEAIACVEALARVPQQKVKWGEFITANSTPNLYEIYYGQVIPRCFRDFKMMTNSEFKGDFKTRYGVLYRLFFKALKIGKKSLLKIGAKF